MRDDLDRRVSQINRDADIATGVIVAVIVVAALVGWIFYLFFGGGK